MKKLLKTLANNLAYTILGIILAVVGGVALASNLGVLNSTQNGDLVTGMTNGNYRLLHPGANGTVLTASSTSVNGVTFAAVAGSGTVTGTGTNGFSAIWNTASSLTNGVMRDNGVVGGINATSSTVSFNVQGSSTLNPFNVSSSSGTSLLRVLANGNVGIASATPAEALSVVGNIYQNGAYIKLGNAEPLFNCRASGSCMELWGNDNTINGTLIGTGNRNNGTSAYTGFFLNNDIANAAVTNYSGLFLNSSTYNDTTFGTGLAFPNQTILQNTMGPLTFSSATTSAGEYINFLVGSNAATSERMRITETGNVGINTTAPSSLLAVQGNSSLPTQPIFTVTSSSGSTLLQVIPTNSNSGQGKVYINPQNPGDVSSTAALEIDGLTGNLSDFIFKVVSNTTAGFPTIGLANASGSPTSVTNLTTSNTQIGSFDGYTWVPTSLWRKVTSITSRVDGTLSTSSAPSKIEFYTTPTGTVTSTLKMTIGQNGSTTLSSLAVSGCDVLATASGGLFCGTNGSGGGSGNSAWTIGNGLIYNATSTDAVLIGTTTPTTATHYIVGSGTKDPLIVASGTGSTLLSVKANGNVGVGTNAPGFPFTVNNATTTGVGTVVSDNGTNVGVNSVFSVYKATLVGAGDVLFNVGTSAQNNQFQIKDQSATNFLYGITSNGVNVGGAAALKISSTNSQNDFLLLEDSATLPNMTLQTALGYGSILLKPATVQMFEASSTAGILINSASPNGTLSVKGIAGINAFDVSSSTGTSLLRVMQTGRVGIGTTTPGYGLVVVGTVQLPGLTTSAGLQTAVLCLNASNEVISDSVACLASAKRFKTDIKPLPVGLDELMKLNPVEFKWTKEFNKGFENDPNKNGIQYSLIADDVQKVDPNLATVEITGKNKGLVHGLADLNHWIALFVQSIKDMEKQIESIFTRLNNQDIKIQELEKKLDKQQHQIDYLQVQINDLKKGQ